MRNASVFMISPRSTTCAISTTSQNQTQPGQSRQEKPIDVVESDPLRARVHRKVSLGATRAAVTERTVTRRPNPEANGQHLGARDSAREHKTHLIGLDR